MKQTSAQVRIVTDTTASLPDGFAAAHGVEVVPQVVLFGEESFLEDQEITYQEFVRRLKISPELPKTAAPPPGLMIEAYQRQLDKGKTILSIHPSAEVSGTVRSALTAQEAFPGADIRILDTRSIGGNLATMVMLAVEWAEAGVEADEIMRRLQAMIPVSHTYFLVATLEYLQKGGRIGGAAALVGVVLKIKPILQVRDGRIEALEKVRTYAHAFNRMVELAIETCAQAQAPYLCVMHADAQDEAERLARELSARLGGREIPVRRLGASITTHGGPGALGVGFFA